MWKIRVNKEDTVDGEYSDALSKTHWLHHISLKENNKLNDLT